MGLLLRRELPAPRTSGARLLPALALIPGVVLLAAAAVRADKLYRSEALRFDARRKIDKLAYGEGHIDAVVPAALIRFQEAVKVDAENGRAWGDLAYATAQVWHVTHRDPAAIGRRAEAAATRALALCAVDAEFWVHQGVALDMQGRRVEARAAFEHALALAPHRPEWHYYYAYHLSRDADRKTEALAAVETCLNLDPSNPQAKSLRARLSAGR
jgi:tetratricopeptide (TPR) repeat protein